MAYARFHGLAKRKSTLTSADSAEAIQLCSRLPKLLRELYQPKCPTEPTCACNVTHKHVPVKPHVIEVHAPHFLKDSWGKWNEQSIEAAHALTNTVNRRFACIRNKVDRLEATHTALQALKDAADAMADLRTRRRGDRAASSEKPR